MIYQERLPAKKPFKDCIYVYCGRENPPRLGNPYPITRTQDRNVVCDKFEIYFDEEMKKEDSAFKKEIQNLEQLALKGDLVLLCFCVPERCHTDTIKRHLDQFLFDQG
jgi:hypothetical protein